MVVVVVVLMAGIDEELLLVPLEYQEQDSMYTTTEGNGLPLILPHNTVRLPLQYPVEQIIRYL
jgi:hypothetical protein